MFDNKPRSVNKVVLIKTEDILPNPAQPRCVFESAQLESLSQSIKENGVLQPISVRKNLKGEYELIAGERRLRAAKLAGMDTIPCIVSDANEQQSAILAILENLQRADLNPIEEAQALYKLIVEWNVTQFDAAARLGIAQSTIANKLRLLKLSPETQKLISHENLNERQARALLKLTDEKLQLEAAAKIAEEGLNVAQSEELISRIMTSGDKYVSKANRPNRKIIIKDVRLFINTINNAIKTMKSAGIPAKAEKNENDDYIEYKVKIPIMQKTE